MPLKGRPKMAHNPLTIELIKNKFIDQEDIQIYYYDNLFEKLLQEGHSYKNLITMTHYIVSRVVSKNFIDEAGNKVENKFGFFIGVLLLHNSSIREFNFFFSSLLNFFELFI